MKVVASIVVFSLLGLVGLFVASRAIYRSSTFDVGMAIFSISVLLSFLSIKRHYDLEELARLRPPAHTIVSVTGTSTTISLKKLVIAILAAATWALLLYQYVVAQWSSVVKPEWGLIFPGAIIFIAVVGAMLACLETSLSNVHKFHLDEWLESRDEEADKIPKKEAAESQKERNAHRYGIFAALISDKEDQTTFLLTVITALDIAFTVLCIRALVDLPEFSPNAPVLFSEWWPFGGNFGFVSVGFALMLLLIVQIVPSKIAIRNTLGCFMRLSWFIRVCNWLRITPVVVVGLGMPIDIVLDAAKKIRAGK